MVTDLICFCTYFFNLNVLLTSLLAVFKLMHASLSLDYFSCNQVTNQSSPLVT